MKPGEPEQEARLAPFSQATCLAWHSLGGADLPQGPISARAGTISARAGMISLLSHKYLISRLGQWAGPWYTGFLCPYGLDPSVTLNLHPMDCG